MTPARSTRVRFFSVLVTLGLLPFAACAEESAHEGHDAHADHEMHGDHGSHDGHGDHTPIDGVDPKTDVSLYQLDGDWTDQSGTAFRLEALRGHPVVLVMFYGTCTSVCPTLVRDAKQLDALLAGDARAKTQFLLVTIDPAVDTPERLGAYAKEHQLDAARWHLVAGAPDQIRALSNVIGFRYRPAGGGQYSHTLRITLLDRDGRIVEHADGLERPIAPLAARVTELAKDSPPPK